MSVDLVTLQTENLRLTDELAQAKSALQRLTFTVQHDLRAPLRHISAFAKVIEEDHGPQLDAPVLAHLKVIEDAATSAMKILDTLAGPKEPKQ
jgi:light-regulated signal transduction histidine kinase (bacteriophytochrome)